MHAHINQHSTYKINLHITIKSFNISKVIQPSKVTYQSKVIDRNQLSVAIVGHTANKRCHGSRKLLSHCQTYGHTTKFIFDQVIFKLKNRTHTSKQCNISFTILCRIAFYSIPINMEENV